MRPIRMWVVGVILTVAVLADIFSAMAEAVALAVNRVGRRHGY